MSHRKRNKQPALARTVHATVSAEQRSILAEPLREELQPQQTVDPILKRAMQQADQGNYAKAIEILKQGKSTPEIMNVRGVCLLRLGYYQEATQLFRSFVLDTGRNLPRPNVPILHIVNFGTALFLMGLPSGCLSLICRMDETQHPSVKRLRDAIRSWVRTLSLWQKLNWYCGQIEPSPCHPKLDFPAGDFTDCSSGDIARLVSQGSHDTAPTEGQGS